MKRNIAAILLISIALLSCKSGNRFDNADLSGIEVNLTIHRFERALFTLHTDRLSQEADSLRIRDPRFFDLFTRGIIGIGKPDSPDFHPLLQRFITDTMVCHAYNKSEAVFGNMEDIKSILEKAFKRYRYHFPNKPIPAVYTFISGYNLSLAIDDSLVAVGLDRYLGADTPQYKLLGIPRYLARKMTPKRVPIDLIRAWMYGAFEFNDSSDNLLANMIYEGEIMYLTKRLLPEFPDSLIFGFTPKQYQWCLNSEESMWTYLIENKLLFTTNTLDINKMIHDAPFTSGFPRESPGRAAVWIGYRIVDRFMENNPELTLNQLMELPDYNEILKHSRYKP